MLIRPERLHHVNPDQSDNCFIDKISFWCLLCHCFNVIWFLLKSLFVVLSFTHVAKLLCQYVILREFVVNFRMYSRHNYLLSFVVFWVSEDHHSSLFPLPLFLGILQGSKYETNFPSFVGKILFILRPNSFVYKTNWIKVWEIFFYKMLGGFFSRGKICTSISLALQAC